MIGKRPQDLQRTRMLRLDPISREIRTKPTIYMTPHQDTQDDHLRIKMISQVAERHKKT